MTIGKKDGVEKVYPYSEMILHVNRRFACDKKGASKAACAQVKQALGEFDSSPITWTDKTSGHLVPPNWNNGTTANMWKA